MTLESAILGGLAVVGAVFLIIVVPLILAGLTAPPRMEPLPHHEPPEMLTWDEHVEKYGPDDPVMKEALKTGEVDDPEFRKKHELPPYDE
ncbi:hypothetical protein HSTV2_85 [Halorubrum sodomense tailed virus 2]|uniref:Uncharacterized protein n=1 Tax=Halorubrum sodomense tailed virus 2 TaxID=1262527 RepID=L7TNC0_9CAUD|nr:hypothetical protein HSTV2_85 [Halorubrum sodomense tailed virus 2]AGC34352.1 hypothetical protein HSTV2_85 [Halorubrum sodomense tailed virus 2]